jgi:2-polyprenyl-3-methyl-5-hydroxy-6-metoxy-1,4-benzoquinol methylase
MNVTVSRPLSDTGERMIPELSEPATFWEHLFRYSFASRRVQGKRVLDIACGEGYGAWLLSKSGARSVIGVDVCNETCEHARSKYGIDARRGEAIAIPLPNASVDVIVSFETIEHVKSPDAFLDECVRVLAPGGILIISTPNAFAHHDSVCNPFHCSEMNADEFLDLLSRKLQHARHYSQSNRWAQWWMPRSFLTRCLPWRRLRGYWRLCKMLRMTEWDNIADRYRSDPTQALEKCRSTFARLTSPYAVRRKVSGHLERPGYIVAVAVRNI